MPSTLNVTNKLITMSILLLEQISAGRLNIERMEDTNSIMLTHPDYTDGDMWIIFTPYASYYDAKGTFIEVSNINQERLQALVTLLGPIHKARKTFLRWYISPSMPELQILLGILIKHGSK